MSTNNPAGAQGWVKSADPQSGRIFYANHVTRVTQWNPPDGWVDDEQDDVAAPSSSSAASSSVWEEMKDPSTGRTFYVNHDTQETTWTKPKDFGTAATKHDSTNTSVTSNGASSYPSTTTTSPFGGVPVVPSSTASIRSSSALERVMSHTTSNSNNNNAYASGTATPKHFNTSRSYPQEAASYFSPAPTPVEVDLSDSMPALDFRVKTVGDELRMNCPHCNAIFTMSKRRHHCRLCGDIFCDACSNHRVTLPLEGPEFEKPVRVCDFCFQDVDKGNFFSMRRYLTPLSLYEPTNERDEDKEQEGGVATAKNVAAALSALTSDLDGMLQSSASFQEKMTIPIDVLIPAIAKHLSLRTTSDRAVRAIASLLALGNVVGNRDYAHGIYLFGGQEAIDNIMLLLERSGSDRKTLFVQEQAARAIFYLTDAGVLSTLGSKQSELRDKYPEDELGGVDALDSNRALRNMLDHSSDSKNPNLQRWAAATIRNLVLEDQRRATLANNDVAAAVASGQDFGGHQKYESFLDDLVSSGGIMILCSLIGADDPDTRAHAMGALGATLTATRAIDGSLAALHEMTGGQAGRLQQKDGQIVRAIVNGGGCGSSLSQLLLSADNTVATMGCDFAASLVMPLLEDPRGTATLPPNYDCRNDQDGLGACREAALAMTSGSCLPALLSLLRDPEMGGRMSRPMELKQKGIETLAAIIMAVGEMGKTNESSTQVQEAIAVITDEGVIPVMLAVLESSSSQSLSSSRDTPSSRIREAAGIILSAMTQCSGDALDELQSCHAISSMLASMSDGAVTSTLRGDGAPRCLGMLHTAAALLSDSWLSSTTSTVAPTSDLMDRLMEALDAGAVTTLSRILFTKMDWESQDKAVGAMKARDAACRMLCAIFGIASMVEDDDGNNFGLSRLYEIVDADAYSRNPPRNVMTAALGILQKSSGLARNILMGATRCGPHYQAAVMDLTESSLLAVGSMCGSSLIPGNQDLNGAFDFSASDEKDHEFKIRRQEVCGIACDILVQGNSRQQQQQGALLPTMLVGGFGEGSLVASLRLSLAIAQHGNMEQHAKLAMSGILVPISDSLRSALAQGDPFKFSASLALVRFCGPHVAAGTGNGLQSVREAIRVATSVLTIPADPQQPLDQLERQESIKAECIKALEALSSNTSLWSSISKDALPAIVSYLHTSSEVSMEHGRETRCAALRAIVRIVRLPSHAVSAAKAGLAEPLAKLVAQGTRGDGLLSEEKDEMPLLALEVLHTIATNGEARREARLLDCGVIAAVCHSLGNAATDKPKKPVDSRADVTFWGLQILHLFLADLEMQSPNIQFCLQSPSASSFVTIVSREPNFVRALCSTLLVTTSMKFDNMDEENGAGDTFDIPRSYGPPFVRVEENCAGYANTHAAALGLMFMIAVYSCAIETTASQSLWKIMLCQLGSKASDVDDDRRLAASMCAHFLRLLLDDKNSPFAPLNEQKRDEYEKITRPLVRHRLLQSLKSCLAEDPRDPYMTSMFVAFEVPRVCLSIWRDPALIDLAFELIKLMITSHEDDLLHIFVESETTLLSLFDMLNVDSSTEVSSEQLEEIRRVVASILGSLAESGLLTQSVERFEVKSQAVSALAAACLAEDDGGVDQDDDEDRTAMSATMSSRCMQCLVELCTIEGEDGSKNMHLSAEEATAIAQRLGKKICQMVISRFIERAKLQQYDVEDEDDVMEAPDVKMLCAIAQHDTALRVIASVGGLHALSLIASEGELTAIVALKHACKEDPSILIDVDGHVSVMKLVVDAEHLECEESRRKTETAAFELLADLCVTPLGRKAVAGAEQCQPCVDLAFELVSSLVEVPAAHAEGADSEPDLVDDTPEPVTEQTETIVQKDGTKPKLKSLAGSFDAESAALSFVSNLGRVEKYRTQVFANESFAEALLMLATDSSPCCPKLQSKAAILLVGLAPFTPVSETEVLSADTLAETFVRLLKLSLPNKLKASVVEASSVVFDVIAPTNQEALVQCLAPEWIALVRKFTVARNTGSDADRQDGSLLAYHLSCLLWRSHPKDNLRELVTTRDILSSMVHLVQWRYDSVKASMPEQDQLHWDAAVANALQVVGAVICGPEVDAKGKNQTLALMKTTLMMARPGKAPRKACDFTTALKRIVDAKKEANSCMIAQRILERTSL